MRVTQTVLGWPMVFALIMVGLWPLISAGAENTGFDARPLMRGRMDYERAATEVQNYIQVTFYLPGRGLYAHSISDRHPDFTWGNGVSLSALVGAARNEPTRYPPILNRFFVALDAYWDGLAPHGGYEPAPTRGGGNDKYYDDNEWMALSYTEAYELMRDPRYLDQAQRCMDFALSGWDDTALGGGIWWHVSRKSKNVCSNAPAAEACLRLACYLPPAKASELISMAKRIVAWTDKTFRDDRGLYSDSISTVTGKMNPAKLTYNTALMIRALLGLYRITGDQVYFQEAIRSADSSDWFLDPRTHAYRDAVKWSHLMVEADLEIFRATGNAHYLQRAMDNADYEYAKWKQMPPNTAIDNASIARVLWLLADMQSAGGEKFWRQVDRRMTRLGP